MWKSSLMASRGYKTYVLMVVSLVFGLVLSACSSAEIKLEPQIYGGSADTSSLENDAVVWVGGCTGTLVTSDLVLSAGHCSGLRQDPPHPDLINACADWEDYRRWYTLLEPRVIRVGQDAARALFITEAREYSLPGCADMILLRLDEPVPASIASPMKVMSYVGNAAGGNDADYFRNDWLKMSGWGLLSALGTPHVRTWIRYQAFGKYSSHDQEKFYIRGEGGSYVREGDSGSPLIWQDLRGEKYVIGVAQGYNPGSPVLSRYTATFRNEVDKGGPGHNYPSVRRWIDYHLGCQTPWTVFDEQLPRSSVDPCTYEFPHCLWGDCELPPEIKYTSFPECPECGFRFTLPDDLNLVIGIKLPDIFKNFEEVEGFDVTLLNSSGKPIGESKFVAQEKGIAGNSLMLYADLTPDTYTFKINLSEELAKRLKTEQGSYAFDVNFQAN